ncbi:hypothetical protein PR048_027228 [Dryococelus australis]|uniref:Uncharacterized protein n=1 Tax=Dryococelus australis TaxID=614101 RepID=A0ABQ9GG78_9NEOP|nr:hypothetical protein PR048_027228 [Dryococelus australis]
MTSEFGQQCYVEFDRPHVLLQNKSGFLWSMVQETGKSMAETLMRIAEKVGASLLLLLLRPL